MNIGGMVSPGGWTYAWSRTAGDYSSVVSAQAHNLHFNNWSVSSDSTSTRARGLPVRCLVY